jgi:hypothetical protein
MGSPLFFSAFSGHSRVLDPFAGSGGIVSVTLPELEWESYVTL